MRFIKMHGAGNDYVYVDCFQEKLPLEPAEIARQISDRHFGVGGDGLVLIGPAERGDVRMRMFNADGSEAEMCGNAIRCVAKYAYEQGLVKQTHIQVETGRGVLELELEAVAGRVNRVRVDMGEPILEADRIPTTLPGNPPLDVPLTVAGRTFSVSCISMGNPHCITFVDQANDDWVQNVGPLVEKDSHFPRRVNAEFVEVHSPRKLRMRVWERGSGETLACGTGAAAVCVAGVLTGRCERRVTIQLLGGDLELEWGADNHVYKTGPATEVFRGEWQPAARSG